MTRCGQKKNEAENYCGNNGVNETSNDRKQQTDFILFGRLVKTKGVLEAEKKRQKFASVKLITETYFVTDLERKNNDNISGLIVARKLNSNTFFGEEAET